MFDSVSITDVITATAAVVAIFYVRYEIRSNRQQTRQTFTVQLSQRDLEEGLRGQAAALSSLLKINDDGSPGIGGADRDGFWSDWEAKSPKARGELLAYLNHLEDVGSLYGKGVLDHDLTLELFGSAAQRYWTGGAWFIKRLREGRGARLFERVEQLANDYVQTRQTEIDELRQLTMQALALTDAEDVSYIDDEVIDAYEAKARDVEDTAAGEALEPVEKMPREAGVSYYYGHSIVVRRDSVFFTNGGPDQPNDPCGDTNRWRLAVSRGYRFDPFRCCPGVTAYRITLFS